jgi:hypothetical protein
MDFVRLAFVEPAEAAMLGAIVLLLWSMQI